MSSDSRLCRGWPVDVGRGYGDRVAVNDARAVIEALADPEALYVFGVVAARTSKLGLPVKERAGTTPYVTPFGLMRETSLSREVVEAAAERLKRAGLLESLVDDEQGYESWRVSEAALAAAVNGGDASRGG
jgi:DNA-binding transcriptional ArsR family regulator